MTESDEITITGVDFWADKPEQLAQLLASHASVIPDPSGRPAAPDQIAVLTLPALWAQNARELRDALAFAAGGARRDRHRHAPRVVPSPPLRTVSCSQSRRPLNSSGPADPSRTKQCNAATFRRCESVGGSSSPRLPWNDSSRRRRTRVEAGPLEVCRRWR